MNRETVQGLIAEHERNLELMKELRWRTDAQRQVLDGLKRLYPDYFTAPEPPSELEAHAEASATVGDALLGMFEASRGRWLSPPEIKANLDDRGTLPPGLRDPDAAIRKALGRVPGLMKRPRDGRTNEFCLPAKHEGPAEAGPSQDVKPQEGGGQMPPP